MTVVAELPAASDAGEKTPVTLLGRFPESLKVTIAGNVPFAGVSCMVKTAGFVEVTVWGADVPVVCSVKSGGVTVRVPVAAVPLLPEKLVSPEYTAVRTCAPEPSVVTFSVATPPVEVTVDSGVPLSRN